MLALAKKFSTLTLLLFLSLGMLSLGIGRVIRGHFPSGLSPLVKSAGHGSGKLPFLYREALKSALCTEGRYDLSDSARAPSIGKGLAVNSKRSPQPIFFSLMLPAPKVSTNVFLSVLNF